MTQIALPWGCLDNSQDPVTRLGYTVNRVLAKVWGSRNQVVVINDERAWQELVAQQWPIVVRQAYRACGRQELAEDVAQEVFLKVVRSINKFRGEQPIGHWIARITSTTTIDMLRRQKQTVSIDVPAIGERLANDDDPAGEIAREEVRQRVRAAILRLPKHLREPIWLSTYTEMTYEEIARTLNVPLRTVMSRAAAARRKLRSTLMSLQEGIS